MKIPFVDLTAQYNSIKSEIDTAINSVISKASFIGGDFVKSFETSFAKFNGVSHCIGCGNGTDSIEILLKAHGVGEGHEVIVPAISWISTSEAVTAIGARPVFVDIEPDYFTIDVTKIQEKITSKTKAIIPVHLYGHPADMPQIMEIAKKNKLIVIEDCAQAHGAEINGKKVGTWGDSASFSFYPGKNLGAYGDAGCMITNDDNVARVARMIGNHGQIKKHDHLIEGRNSRLDSLQASILSAKLPHLNSWTDSRIKNANYYSKKLTDSPVKYPATKPGHKHVFHLYVIRVENRKAVMDKLSEQGIETAIHYPTALPFLKAYSYLNHQPSDFPVANLIQNEILSIPMYAELTHEMIDHVSRVLLKAEEKK